MAEKMHCRPSAVLGVQDPALAFCVDRATMTLVSAIEGDMDARTKRLPDNAKASTHERARQKVLDEYLGVELADQPQRFRAPNTR
jgi:hypothetical protein